MDPLTLGLAAAAAAGFAAAAALASKLKAARAALAELQSRPAPPPPPRPVESRREYFGLLWFPTLTVKDDERLVVAAAAGLPHCPKCVRPMALSAGAAGEWVCAGCSDRRAGTAADIQVTDAVVADALQEYLRRHPGWRAANGLAAPKSSAPG